MGSMLPNTPTSPLKLTTKAAHMNILIAWLRFRWKIEFLKSETTFLKKKLYFIAFLKSVFQK
jgi:hypothetical protein